MKMNVRKNDNGIWEIVNNIQVTPREIETLDTTLRDGEQGGKTFKAGAKKRITKRIADAGVSTAEVGFPSSNQIEYDTVKEIADTINGPYICGLTLCDKSRIDTTWKALKNNPKPTIHIFLKNTDEASVRAYNIDLKKQLQEAVSAVAYTKEIMGGKGRIEFSAQNLILALNDSLDPRFAYLQDYISLLHEGVINEGVDIINIPHTVAKGTKISIGDTIRYFKLLVPSSDKVKLSFHPHNDFGLGLSDMLEAIEVGISQIEGCWYNLGERSGNTALEQIISVLKFNPLYNERFYTKFDVKQICQIMRYVEKESSIPIPHNAPFGPNAFSHGSGVHQDGDKKGRDIGENIYLPCEPSDVGWTGVTHTITKLTGKGGVHARFNELGYDFNIGFIEQNVMPIIKSKDINHGDIELRIIGDDLRYQDAGPIKFVDLAISKFLHSNEYAVQVMLEINGEEKISKVYHGSIGSIDAVCEAIDNMVNLQNGPRLIKYDPKNTGETHQSDAEALIILSGNGKDIDYNIKSPLWLGTGVNSDTLKASAMAYVQALSRYMIDKQKQ